MLEEEEQAGAVKILLLSISGGINLWTSRGREGVCVCLCVCEQTLVHHGGQVIPLNAAQLLSVWRLEAAIMSGCRALC